MSEDNPYAAPLSSAPVPLQDPNLEPGDKKKVDSIIKDAGQFWLAIILCILCSGIFAVIVPIWYLIRLLQWSRLARKYPALMNSSSPAGSLPARFRASQWKLIVGLTIGCLMIFMVLAYIGLLFLGAVSL